MWINLKVGTLFDFSFVDCTAGHVNLSKDFLEIVIFKPVKSDRQSFNQATGVMKGFRVWGRERGTITIIIIIICYNAVVFGGGWNPSGLLCDDGRVERFFSSETCRGLASPCRDFRKRRSQQRGDVVRWKTTWKICHHSSDARGQTQFNPLPPPLWQGATTTSLG